MNFRAGGFIAVMTALGAIPIAFAIWTWQWQDPARFLAYLAVSVAASALKVTLPTINGTMSVNFLFFLIAIMGLNLPEAIFIGCLGTLVQCLYRPASKVRPAQVTFSVANIASAVASSWFVYHGHIPGLNRGILPMPALAALAFFLMNTIPVAAVIALSERRPFLRTWRDCHFWYFPYYLGGASGAWMLSVAAKELQWQGWLLLLPVVYFIYHSYRLYMDRLSDEKKHVEEVAELHLRTIEALALAIEAKDQTTHDHLRRVRIYAMEVARELGLGSKDLDALRAASLLHDIGKLAVPEHIIAKPGKLTPEEFDKIKIHPIVGAEILERVKFPYPVVPIVRAHHEKWDGSGYPAGLKGEEIPLGARILAVVDCLDALASDRQYRRALPLDRAMEFVVSESGRSFDPRVVEVLQRRYIELEGMARAMPPDHAKLSTGLKIVRGSAPAAGFEHSERTFSPMNGIDPLSSIAAARQEVQMLFELTQDLGSSLSLSETLSVVAVRLKRLVPHDSIAVYVQRDDTLFAEYANGENFRLFSSLEIPVGQGLSGWVAENRKPILNGNPSVEAGYLCDPTKFSTLRSALAVPLQGLNGTMGVLAIYRAEKDSFSKDHLRVLLAISSKVSISIQNALKYRQVENSATTDYLTTLPNARSLFLRLDSELARCKRTGANLTALVCDLDGFKQINDRFGHLEGNKVLRFVAARLRESCREYDYVARMGGDEFVVLLPGVSREFVQDRIAHMCQHAIEAGKLITGSKLLSMSIGEACFPADGNDAEDLLAEADRRMYQAKQRHKEELWGEVHMMPEPRLAPLPAN